MLKRSDIVASAKSFLGTRWVHQGRTRAGVDCVGLVVAVADDLGILPSDFHVPPYRTQPDASLLSYFDRYMTRINPRDARNGSVAVFAFGGSPYHAGIITDLHVGALIHAYASKHKVVYDYLESRAKGRVFLRAYDYPGVTDG